MSSQGKGPLLVVCLVFGWLVLAAVAAAVHYVLLVPWPERGAVFTFPILAWLSARQFKRNGRLDD